MKLTSNTRGTKFQASCVYFKLCFKTNLTPKYLYGTKCLQQVFQGFFYMEQLAEVKGIVTTHFLRMQEEEVYTGLITNE